MSEVLRKVWHCDKCRHEWFTAEKPQRCPRCKVRTWNVPPETAAVQSVPVMVPNEPTLVQTEPVESEELDVTAPEISGCGKATLTKVVKRKPEQSSQPCRHGLFYHPNCNG
jgi:hypothetical protein